MKKLKILFAIIMLMSSYSITAQGISITDDGTTVDGSAMLEVKSTSKGFLPPRLSKGEMLSIPSPAEGLVVYNTTSKTLNVFNGTNWTDMTGTVQSLAIGDFFAGGIVFYLDGSGGGMVCAINDQDDGSGIQWYNGSYITTGATGTSIGTGYANTWVIIEIQGAGNYAAKICENYSGGGYDDWFLPSKDALSTMAQNSTAINATATANGGIAFNGYYWSSSEYSINYAWDHYLSFGGSQDPRYKSTIKRVRAVRDF